MNIAKRRQIINSATPSTQLFVSLTPFKGLNSKKSCLTHEKASISHVDNFSGGGGEMSIGKICWTFKALLRNGVEKTVKRVNSFPLSESIFAEEQKYKTFGWIIQLQ